MPHKRRKISGSPGQVAGVAAASILLAASLAACSSGSDEEAGYACTDAQGQVVDDSKCNDDPGGHYFWHSYPYSQYPNGRPTGGTRLTGGKAIRSNDSAAREAGGLPKTGSVKGGTRVSAHSGGFGSGHAGSNGGGGHGGSSGS